MLSDSSFISIDQNSHVLWDTVPKLDVLRAGTARGTHCIEDVDTAFTKRGSSVGNAQLEIMRERYYRDGSSDWGASLFYSDFLGRTPINIRDLEPFTGFSTKALAKALNLTVDELYERYADSDNWQLVGSSYAGNTSRHRIVGDLGLDETLPYLTELVQHARQDILAAFPAPDAQRRINTWFDDQRHVVNQLSTTLQGASLVQFYQGWMEEHFGTSIVYRMTSDVFGDRLKHNNLPLLTAFLTDYSALVSLYNAAVAGAAVGLDPLAMKQGELPFFAVWRGKDQLYRTEMQVQDGALVADGREWPVSNGCLKTRAMQESGLVCIVGKAVLLVLEARIKGGGAPLVLPEHGSLYMPAVHAFERRLQSETDLNLDLFPVYRVCMNFLSSLARSSTMLRLPEYLGQTFGQAELPCIDFAEALPNVLADADKTLERLRNKDARKRFIDERNPSLAAEIKALEEQQKQLARVPETRDQASGVWDRIKDLKRGQLESYVDALLCTLHVRNLTYWNSRGALLPWSIAAGGDAFYNELVQNAAVITEDAQHEA